MVQKLLHSPINSSWTISELLESLKAALSCCSSTDVVLTTTDSREKFLPFSEFSMLRCGDCGAVCRDSGQFLTHTLKCRFGGVHVMLYKRLGMIHKNVQRALRKRLKKCTTMVGRALRNNRELCVLTPVFSPLAPFILNGVSVSTCVPKRKNTYAETDVKGPGMKRVTLYFCVHAIRRRFDDMEEYDRLKKARRRYRDLKRTLKSFTLDVQDLFEHPPRDREVARLLHEATGLPIGIPIIPARKIGLQVPTFSVLDLCYSQSDDTVCGSSRIPIETANTVDVQPTIGEIKPCSQLSSVVTRKNGEKHGEIAAALRSRANTRRNGVAAKTVSSLLGSEPPSILPETYQSFSTNSKLPNSSKIPLQSFPVELEPPMNLNTQVMNRA